MVDGTTSDNPTSFIVKNMMEFGRLSETNFTNKLVYFGANEIIVFQGVENGVIAHIMQKHTPFVSGVHYMAHHTNMVV